jgi:hypothetical protein
VREAIERRIAEFLAGADPRFDWLRALVGHHHFLPLLIGWVSTLGIRPDGSFVRFDHEAEPATVADLRDPYWQRMALCEGARRYPELRALIPGRPAESLDCASCRGRGEFPGHPELRCQCGGLGWLGAGEPTRERAP